MDFNHFGELLNHVRVLNNLTINQLADGICSDRQLIRIENGESVPSVYILHNLSIKLNIDLQEYYKIYFCTKFFSAHKYKDEFNNLIITGDYQALRKLVEQIEIMNEFKEGENLQYILYGKAICSVHIDKDYLLSNDYCYQGLSIENPGFSLDNIKDKIYSNISLTMINLLASNYNTLNDTDKSYNAFKDLFFVLDNYILNLPFPMYRSIDFQKKLYQSVTYNLAVILTNKENYNKALYYITKGIEFSLRENYMRFLPELLKQRSRLLYKIQNYEESYKSYEICLNFYKLSRDIKDIDKLEKEIRGMAFQKR